MATDYTIFLGALTGIYVCLHLLLYYTQDRREPPSVDTLVPFVSPIIGMSKKKTRYHIELRYIQHSEVFC